MCLFLRVVDLNWRSTLQIGHSEADTEEEEEEVEEEEEEDEEEEEEEEEGADDDDDDEEEEEPPVPFTMRASGSLWRTTAKARDESSWSLFSAASVLLAFPAAPSPSKHWLT